MRFRARLLDRAVAAYRLLLLVYPLRFRRAYGSEMVEVFRARCSRALAASGWPGLAAWLLRAVLDVAWNAPLERFASVRGGDPRGDAKRDPPLTTGGFRMIRLLPDLRFALRMLLRQPGLSVTLVLTLALGTGATVALFSIVDAALLRPLPYPRPERLVAVRQLDPEFGPTPFAPPYLDDLRERISGIEMLSGFSPSWELTLTGVGEPRRVVAAYVSAELFDLLGVRPLVGRTFEPAELATGGARAVVVSKPFWERSFGEAAALDGQTVRLDDESYAIVGVVPAFPLPITASLVSSSGARAELWLPFSANPYAELRAIPVMNVIGRIADGSSEESLAAELDAARLSIAREHAEASGWTALSATSLAEVVTQGGRRGVLTLFGAAAFLLLIACANVANLLLARATARGHELSVRQSLGAGPRQILSQLVTESVVIATLGSALGLLIAWWLLSGALVSGLTGLPPSADVRVDLRVAGFAALLALGTALTFGLLPAAHAVRSVPSKPLREGARATAGRGRLRGALVTSQLALAVSLLVGAGLLARSFWNLVHVDPGFRAEGLLQIPIPFSSDRYQTPASRRALLGELLPRLAALPGASQVAAVNRLPLGGGNVLVGFEAEGSPAGDGRTPTLDRRVATPGYFALMGIPVVEGRDFAGEDGVGMEAAAIVNEAFVRRFWPGSPATGRRLRLMLRGGPGPWLTVVGVAGDVRHHGLDAASEPEIYVPYAQASVESMTVLVRSAGDPMRLLDAARTAVWEIDSEMPVDGAGPVAALVSDSVGEPRLRTLVLNGFAGLALLLSAIGIYGVISYSVTQRTREMGVRIALGAHRRQVILQVMREGVAFAGWGVLLGLAGAWLVGRLLAGLLFDVQANDPLTFAAVAVALPLVALSASLIPARRAARVDPVRAFQGD